MFWESVAIAFEGLRANKMRSLLTMLGIIIGVGAVIAMVSIGLGVRDKVQKADCQFGQQSADHHAGFYRPVRGAGGGRRYNDTDLR